MRTAQWLLVVVLCAAPAWAQRAEEEAGDVSEVDKDSSGPLRDRIPPVSGYQFRQGGRFEVSPNLGISIRDAFFTKIFFGSAFTYHFTNMWAVSARANYTLSLISGAAQICAEGTGCRAPTLEELTTEGGTPKNVTFGKTTLIASVDLQWAPIYGKLSFSAERFAGFTMYALIGPAVVLYGPDQISKVAIGGNVGLGFRFFFNKWLTLRTELRDTIYYEQGSLAPLDSSRDSLRNQLHVEVGFSMFFPSTFTED